MNIRLTTSEIDHICSQIKSAKSQGNGAIGKVSRAQNVDKDISSRLSISRDLDYLSKETSYDLERLEALLCAIHLAENDFEDADQAIRSKSKTTAAHIREAVWDASWETKCSDLYSRIIAFSKKSTGLLTVFGLMNIFSTAGPLVGGASIILLGRLAEIIKSKTNEPSAEPEDSNSSNEGAAEPSDETENEKIDPNEIMNADNVIHFDSHSNPKGACVIWSLTALVRRAQAFHGQETLIEAKTIYSENGNTNVLRGWNKSSDLSVAVKEQTGFSLGYLRNGGGRSVESLNQHLEQSEAGLVCYFGGKSGGPNMPPHAVVITRVENGHYYCLDYSSKGAASSSAHEILLEESSLVEKLGYPSDYDSLLGYLNEVICIK